MKSRFCLSQVPPLALTLASRLQSGSSAFKVVADAVDTVPDIKVAK